ncbi:hypothetical protein CFC35_05790 [Streptomyces sp. FBKL.4005]|uniref:hypothetical protein n=1 Tax=Streptomyces sp. FBKL.4005 TaxID=2015515 RepID=UPI000B95CF2C|nr:hypothetical protein [Streptomyces sp. FBKL.4005]OYP14077.1 hypothetical protein CFC35_05790 [Streptomyces sp. FBKL.4005]
MALNILGITDAVVSHAMASGRFETVNGHEPKNAPSTGGLTAAVWSERVTPVRSSGLDVLSVLLIFNVRIYASAVQESADAIDPDMLAAVDDLCAAYTGDFTLGGLVRQVDLLGIHGQPLDVRAGYLQQDGLLYRVLTISLPVIVNDLWEEVA